MAFSRIGVVGAGAWGLALAIAAARARARRAPVGTRRAPPSPSCRRRAARRACPASNCRPGSRSPPISPNSAIATRCCWSRRRRRRGRRRRGSRRRCRRRPPLVHLRQGARDRDRAIISAMSSAEAAPGFPLAALSGPSFAADVAAGLPTAVTLAAADAAPRRRRSPTRCRGRTSASTTATISRGVEIGGAAKNVLAIACGAAAGLGLGASASAALVARGFAELGRFGAALRRARLDVDGAVRPRRSRADLRLAAVAQFRVRLRSRPRAGAGAGRRRQARGGRAYRAGAAAARARARRGHADRRGGRVGAGGEIAARRPWRCCCRGRESARIEAPFTSRFTGCGFSWARLRRGGHAGKERSMMKNASSRSPSSRWRSPWPPRRARKPTGITTGTTGITGITTGTTTGITGAIMATGITTGITGVIGTGAVAGALRPVRRPGRA